MKDPSGVSGANKIMLSIIGGFSVLVIGGIVILSITSRNQAGAGTGARPNVATYSVSDDERPRSVVSSKFEDLGTIKVKEQKKVEFTIENTGSKPLILSDISSSCGCTVGQVKIDETVSPEFGMHSRGSWQGTVQPGKKAALMVIYRPYVMPVVGIVSRDVYVKTNDPENRELTFTVRADVED